mgnify:FL=1
MIIPKLKPTNRSREFDSYSDELRSQVIHGWLFSKKTHRELDEEVLGIDKTISRGYQSMGILHFLGLKADFHSFFKGIPEERAITLLRNNVQDFQTIISILEGNEPILNIQELIYQERNEISKAKEDASETRLQRIAQSDKRPKRLRVYSYTYHRNSDIIIEAQLRAHGICENCKQPAPFERISDGSPFLEVHHINSLADGGEDTLDNVIALCPNCHRKKHYG